MKSGHAWLTILGSSTTALASWAPWKGDVTVTETVTRAVQTCPCDGEVKQIPSTAAAEFFYRQGLPFGPDGPKFGSGPGATVTKAAPIVVVYSTARKVATRTAIVVEMVPTHGGYGVGETSTMWTGPLPTGGLGWFSWSPEHGAPVTHTSTQTITVHASPPAQSENDPWSDWYNLPKTTATSSMTSSSTSTSSSSIGPISASTSSSSYESYSTSSTTTSESYSTSTSSETYTTSLSSGIGPISASTTTSSSSSSTSSETYTTSTSSEPYTSSTSSETYTTSYSSGIGPISASTTSSSSSSSTSSETYTTSTSSEPYTSSTSSETSTTSYSSGIGPISASTTTSSSASSTTSSSEMTSSSTVMSSSSSSSTSSSFSTSFTTSTSELTSSTSSSSASVGPISASTSSSLSSSSTTSSSATITTSSASLTSSSSTSSIASSTTTSAPPAVATDDVRGFTYIDAILEAHNVHRRNHSATDLTWSTTMAGYAAQTVAKCIFQHDLAPGGGGYGQNIGSGYSPGQVPVMIGNDMYNGEEPNFPTPFGNDTPDMTNFEHWGHFSQIVWKGTAQVGCATQSCTNGLLFTVCNYYPAGNFVGQFSQVGAPLGQPMVVMVADA